MAEFGGVVVGFGKSDGLCSGCMVGYFELW